MKDAIRVCRATSKGPAREQRGIRQLAEMLDLDDEKIRFIEDACVQDEKILDGKLSDSQIAATAKELAARATSVGVPVAAVYLSGSVTGLSAAGIASGLATLGIGGVLGLSAMVTWHRRGHHRRRNHVQGRAMGSGWIPAGPGVAPGADAAGGPAHPPGSDHQPR